MNKNQDNLDITIDSSCNWCFLDPGFVFGNPSTMLPINTYYVSGPTTYGVLTAVKDGTVTFSAVAVGSDCPADTDTGHTITVTG